MNKTLESILSVSQKIAKQNSEDFEMLQTFLKCPAMYIGNARFDYAFHFLGGYSFGKKEATTDWFPCREIQYWMLHNYGIVLDSGALQGYSLLFRCFGFENLTFEKYKCFIEEPLPQGLVSVYNEIQEYQKSYNLVRYDFENNIPKNHNKNLAEAIEKNIKIMISRAGFSYNKLRIFIRRERLFCMVRFLIRGENGWIDDKEFITKSKNHDSLIALYANALQAQCTDLRDCGYDYMIDKDTSNLMDNGITYSNPFFIDYLQWKENMMGKT